MSAPISDSAVLFRQRILRQAGYYLGKLDGKHGKKTEAAIVEWDRTYRVLRSHYGERDGRSEESIRSVLPAMQEKARQLLLEWKLEGMSVKVISGTRTYAEQNAVYAQGRTKPGKRVTKARGGYSNHNFALAIDIGIFTAAGAYIRDSPLPYNRAAKLSHAVAGIARGADWPERDRPHYELDHGLTLKEVRRRFEVGEMIWTIANP